MFTFKKQYKDYLLKGRTIKYVANLLDIQPQYLSDIIGGRKHPSKRLVKQILALISPDAKVNDFFIIKEK